MKTGNVATNRNGLRRQDQSLTAMFGQAPVGVARIAPDGHFLVANPALCHMLGYSKRELLMKTWEEITHPDDRVSGDVMVAKIVSGDETAYTIEKRYLRRGGMSLWVTETSSAVADDAGSLLYRICVVQVNERKLAERYFQSAVEAAPSGMAIVNQKGKIVLVNSRTEQLFGYSREDLIGRSIEFLLASSLEKSQRGFLKGLIRQLEGRPIGAKWDLYGRRRDGELFPVELALNPVQTLKGTLVLSSISDKSKRTRPDEYPHPMKFMIPIVGIDSVARNTNDRPPASMRASRAG